MSPHMISADTRVGGEQHLFGALWGRNTDFPSQPLSAGSGWATLCFSVTFAVVDGLHLARLSFPWLFVSLCLENTIFCKSLYLSAPITFPGGMLL